MEMNEELKKAQILVEALPYIQKFNRKIIVVKYGGSAMVDEELKKKVIQDVVLLKLAPLSCHQAVVLSLFMFPLFPLSGVSAFSAIVIAVFDVIVTPSATHFPSL